MTLVEIKLNNHNRIKKVVVYGHSGYEELGKDIVCSAVSTAMYVSMGLIEKTCSDYTFTSNEEKAYMELVINKSDDFTNLVVENMVEALEGISEQYPSHLKIKIEK